MCKVELSEQSLIESLLANKKAPIVGLSIFNPQPS